jgi:hypothetical protein
MNIEDIFEKLFSFYQVSSVAELSPKINTSQKTISNWKVRSSVNAIKKKCRELKIYDEIFGTINVQEISKKSDEVESENKSDLSKYFTALQSVAIATNKEDELLTDIRELIKKYMQ